MESAKRRVGSSPIRQVSHLDPLNQVKFKTTVQPDKLLYNTAI